jgi:hypothetical protein
VVEQLTLGDRGSECAVSLTHKAFTYLPETNLLALPTRLVESASDEFPWDWSAPTFDGVVVLRVDLAEGFTELGRVEAVTDEYDWFGWRRAAIIGDDVYALSVSGIRGATLSDFTNPGTIEFEPLDDEWDQDMWQGMTGGAESDWGVGMGDRR